jgi:hypothetical protein
VSLPPVQLKLSPEDELASLGARPEPMGAARVAPAPFGRPDALQRLFPILAFR